MYLSLVRVRCWPGHNFGVYLRFTDLDDWWQVRHFLLLPEMEELCGILVFNLCDHWHIFNVIIRLPDFKKMEK